MTHLVAPANFRVVKFGFFSGWQVRLLPDLMFFLSELSARIEKSIFLNTGQS